MSKKQRFMPIPGMILLSIFIIAGLGFTVWGIRDLSRGVKDAAVGLYIGLPILAFPLIILTLRVKQRRADFAFAANLPTASKSFGILLHRGGEKRGNAPALLVAGGIMLVITLASCFLGNDILKSDRGEQIAGLIMGLLSIGLIAGGFVLLRGSRAHRSGIRVSDGVLWDISRNKLTCGQFEVRLRPGGTSRKQGVERITATREESVSDVLGRPGIEINVARPSGQNFQIGSLSLGGRQAFAPKSPGTAFAPHWLNLLMDDEIVTLECFGFGSVSALCKQLREIGTLLKRISGGSLPVKLCVGMPEMPPKNDGILTPTNIGVGVARVAGVSGIVGALAGAAIGSAMAPTEEQIALRTAEQIQLLVFGDPSQPDSESLKRVAEEMGWTVEAPGGINLGSNLEGVASRE